MLGPVDDGDSLGVPDGDDYKALVEMEDFQSQVRYHYLEIKYQRTTSGSSIN